jgi:imidazolonepropionase
MTLACTQLGLGPNAALAACTVNAAHVLGRGDRLGRVSPGFAADLVLLDAPDWRHLAYHFGGDLISVVVKDGSVAWTR